MGALLIMAQIIDLALVRALRHTGTANRNLQTAADCLLESTDHVQNAADRLLVALNNLTDKLDTIARRASDTVNFCAECRESFEMTDLAAMEAARDRLVASFETQPRFF